LARYEQGEFELALSDLNEAIRLAPRDYQALLTRGRTYQAVGDLDGAIRDFTTVIDFVPASLHAHYNRGLCFMQKGRKAEAADDFKFMLENSRIQEDKDEATAWLRKLGPKYLK
jgi:tetratricopeptide (TPR) repeat protein